MKIVVLDGHPLNPGDLDWAPLAELGDLTVHERSTPEQIESRAAQAEALLTVRAALNRETIRHLAKLRFLGVLSSDASTVNLEAARKRGVHVATLPGVDAESVAQHTFSLLLELCSACGHHAHAVRNGRWTRSPDFTFRFQPIRELHGLTLGLIGCGRIGSVVARIARGFGMTVLVNDPQVSGGIPEGTNAATLDEVLAQSDVVSLHCALTPQTERIINPATLGRMKPDAFLLNTAAGALLDEAAVADALRNRRLGGAGLDVLTQEPPSARHPLLQAPRCVITPRLGWATRETRARIIREMAAQLRLFTTSAGARAAS
jgi:glycerate dehydrogenase